VHDGDAPEGALAVRDPAVPLLEGLSVRGPLEVDAPADQAGMLGGLAKAFRQTA
jgi:hypothetical protein